MDQEELYRKFARETYASNNEVDIDPRAVVSVSEDTSGGGAWVAAWVWVDEASIAEES